MGEAFAKGGAVLMSDIEETFAPVTDAVTDATATVTNTVTGQAPAPAAADADNTQP